MECGLTLSTITTIEPQVHNPRRANVYVDGQFAASLSLALVEEAGLRAGATVDAEQLAQFMAADADYRAIDSAYAFLSYRPRSEREVRQRLGKKGFEPAVIDRIVERLQAQGLLDDSAFAQYWRQNRESFNPRGQRLIRLELRQKGVEASVAADAIADLDETDSAYRAGQKQAGRLAGLADREFRQKLGAFLVRRGFGYDVVREVVARLWQETGHQRQDDEEPS